MASSKAALKAIKASIDAGNFDKAASEARDLVKADEKNYNGFMFLGYANEKLGNLDIAENALRSALTLKGEDIQALKGLVTLFEKQAAAQLDAYHDVVHRLAKIYADQEDRMQCQNLIDKYEGFAKRYGNRAQYRRALELILPTSDIYHILEGRVQHPSLTYKRILESCEAEENEWINAQIAERRTRLGAKIDQVTREVRFEAIAKFQVEEKYQQLIDWTIDDTTRHELEEKLLVRAYENLQSVPYELKPTQRDKVLTTANGMVIIKHPFEMAWSIALEWVDAEDLSDWDVAIFQEYISLFPNQGLAKVLRGFLDSSSSPFPLVKNDKEGGEDGKEKMSEADQLILMSEGLEDCPTSMLAHRVMAYTYLSLQEQHSAVDLSRKAQKLYLESQQDFALTLQDSLDAVNLILSNALIVYQSPRHHPEAKKLLQNILSRKPNMTAALLGFGLILEEDEDYGEAAGFLKQALERDPSNMRIILEHAWCNALDQDLESGKEELEAALHDLQQQKQPDLGMKSVILYRLAYCIWHLNPESTARKDRTGAYRYLIDSVKANPSYPPPYTLLGIYFLDYGKSKQRAKQALQKAFELSSSELVAAEKLARLFANGGEWDLVELVAQRVVDSGKARPSPGSKKKALSWPYAALGIVQMTRQQFASSIVSFQAALRISPQDYHSWVGLGESYHNSGRYVAAARAFQRAESLDHGLSEEESWFAKYMLANVQREVGAFDEAITAYESVLSIAGDDFGVLIALLQTCTENAWTKLAQGMFGQAIRLSQKALSVAERVSKQKADAFNLWKSIGDACSVVAHVKAFLDDVDISVASSLLGAEKNIAAFEVLSNIDKIALTDLAPQSELSKDEISNMWLKAAILSHKKAINVSASDTHAQAVAWYNLGWAERNAYAFAELKYGNNQDRPKRYLKAAIRSFKQAIELEASNSEFWNALGVVTMTMNPKISQHAFVRSLHLNDHSARTWTNLATLYLINNDPQLANEAFTRAQSADPEYAAAWIGQGLLATLTDNSKEARGLYQHAFEIADASSIPAKRHYAVSAFDHLLQIPEMSNNIHNLLRPLFALRQLYIQQPLDEASTQLLALYAERVGEYDDGVKSLEEVCARAEEEYEKSESTEYLAKYAQAKADLARQLLSSGSFKSAIENAETALDLSSEDDLGPDYAERRQKWRLSAHITAGLAHSRLSSFDQSITMFQAALDESHHAPDIACMLAQVLWAKGGKAEKDAARTQLYNSVENHPDHVQSVSLLAVIGLLDGDDDILEAVEDDLKAIRTSDKVDVPEKIKVSRVLAGIVPCRSNNDSSNIAQSLAADAMTGIMISPSQPQGWLELAQATYDHYATDMALAAAQHQVPPHGDLGAEELALAYAHSRKPEYVQIATMVAPWLDHGIDVGP